MLNSVLDSNIMLTGESVLVINLLSTYSTEYAVLSIKRNRVLKRELVLMQCRCFILLYSNTVTAKWNTLFDEDNLQVFINNSNFQVIK